MFEKLFGKKKQTRPAIEGVAHFDESILEEEKFDDGLDSIQTNFSLEDGKKFKKEKISRDWDLDEVSHDNIREKVSNERKHPKLGEQNSDWKEKESSALDLPEEDIDEVHLNANVDHNLGHEDYEEDHREAA